MCTGRQPPPKTALSMTRTSPWDSSWSIPRRATSRQKWYCWRSGQGDTLCKTKLQPMWCSVRADTPLAEQSPLGRCSSQEMLHFYFPRRRSSRVRIVSRFRQRDSSQGELRNSLFRSILLRWCSHRQDKRCTLGKVGLGRGRVGVRVGGGRERVRERERERERHLS